MGTFRDKINDKLHLLESNDKLIEKIISSFNELQKEGGVVKFVLYPKGGSMCDIIITEKTAETFIKILLTERDDMLKSIRKEFNEYIDEEMRII